MSKETQINEITAFLKECERRDYLLITRPSALAEHLYNEGYRKQGEVAREIFEEIDDLFDKIFEQIEDYQRKIESNRALDILVCKAQESMALAIKLTIEENITKKHKEGK